MKKTPLNAVEHELGGKMIDFGGWELPVQFTSIIDEHQAVLALINSEGRSASQFTARSASSLRVGS